MSAAERRDDDLAAQLEDLATFVEIGDQWTARAEAGEIGEAAAAVYASELAGGGLLSQHTPGDAPQGIDLTYLGDDDQLHVAEVKTIGYGEWRQPSTSATVDGRQMDQDWIAGRLDGVGITADAHDIGPDSDQVRAELFQVDIPGDTFATYEIGDDGRRTDSIPSEIWALSEIVDLGDADESDGESTGDTER